MIIDEWLLYKLTSSLNLEIIISRDSSSVEPWWGMNYRRIIVTVITRIVTVWSLRNQIGCKQIPTKYFNVIMTCVYRTEYFILLYSSEPSFNESRTHASKVAKVTCWFLTWTYTIYLFYDFYRRVGFLQKSCHTFSLTHTRILSRIPTNWSIRTWIVHKTILFWWRFPKVSSSHVIRFEHSYKLLLYISCV